MSKDEKQHTFAKDWIHTRINCSEDSKPYDSFVIGEQGEPSFQYVEGRALAAAAAAVNDETKIDAYHGLAM